MSDDGETGTVEWLVLGGLLVIGATFLVEPAAASVGAVIDFLDAFPSPAALGPYGSVIALIAMLLGGGGLVRKKL